MTRPEMLEKPVAIYDWEDNDYPDRLRVSFSNGRTVIYDRRIVQPAPQIAEANETIRKWHRQDYQRRRRRA